MSCAEPMYMHMSRSFRMLQQHTQSLEQESEAGDMFGFLSVGWFNPMTCSYVITQLQIIMYMCTMHYLGMEISYI